MNHELRPRWNGGGLDQPALHSICIDPRDSARVTVAVSSGGVWRTVDGGESWRPHTKGMVAAYVPPEQAEDPEHQDPHCVDQKRAPIAGSVVVNRTRNGGTDFEPLRTGLPQENAYDLVLRHALDISGDGERLAFGSTAGNLWVTDDQGDHWHSVTHHLPPVYSVRYV